MTLSRTIFKTILFIAANLMAIYLHAGHLKGVVTDKKSHEPIIGANVVIQGSLQNTLSGLDGSFLLKNIPEGNATLMIRYLGYQAQTIPIVIKQGRDITELSIELDEESQKLNEVTIHGTEDKSTDESAVRTMQQSERIINVVSAKSIQISPDITVANVVQRVSGISVERNSNGDGQYAIVRGMDKRYNYTLVNGVKIPSPDNKYRYVPLDIFPAELLDRLEVSKSLTPNMEGDAIGGAVNMVMKDAPNSRYISANIATGYSELFMERDFKSFDYSQINKLSPYEEHGKYYQATAADFPTGMVDYKMAPPPPNLLAGLALGNRFLNKKLGVMVAGSYQNTYRGSNSLFYSAENVDTNKIVTITQRSERQFSERQERLGLHSKLDYRFNNRHKLQWYNAYMNLTNIQTRDTKTIDYTAGYDPEHGIAKLSYSTRSRVTIQQIYNSTLQGKHSLNDQLDVNWSAVYSIATNQVPDNTSISLRGERENNVDRITTADNETRRWERNSDQDLTGYANLVYRTRISGSAVEWMTGGMYRYKTRDNFFNNYQLQINPNYVNAEYGKDFHSYTEIPWDVQNPQGSVATSLYYSAGEKITAGYGQVKFDVWKTQVIGGARVEATNQSYALQYPAGENYPEGEQKYVDVLPSIHLKHTLSKNQFLKASYYKAINRPGFFEIVPYRIKQEEYEERGNPNLRRAIGDNIDLRYELFPKPNEQFMVGVFYKKIKDPIEYTLQPDANRGQDIYYSPGNFGTVYNYGAEIDFIKYFRKIGFKANYTYTNSSITTTKSKRIRNDQGDLQTIAVNQTRPLCGQSTNIANITLMFRDQKSGIDAQVAWSYTGERINTVSQFVDNDLWQRGFSQLDASAEKRFKNKLTLFIKANNLLNTPMELFVKGTNPQNTDVPDQQTTSGETLIRKDYFQRSYMIGLRYKL